ncbi:MAG: ABC transporter substrate-binding protein [Microthrixaceae bacterium]|nr:ABC transporter substrate-binding protein [Microthrixaceae bacterium]
MNTHSQRADHGGAAATNPGRWWLAPALLVLTAMLAAACGGGDDGSSGGSTGEGEDASPVSGGELVYGLEAANSGGWCLPEAQLAISGIMVAKQIYDTLTIPNAEAEFVPFLAESVEPNEDHTVWTIKLRDGVVFHDGSPLTAEVVKNNIDAWRGEYPGRTTLLLRFAYSPVQAVEVVDDLTLTVTTSLPWPSFPSYLYYQGRVGIMGQAQLDDPDGCDENLIGTGPFEKQEWVQNDHFTAVRNAEYWLTDDEGTQLPYLDQVEFRPYPETDSRVNALLTGGIQAMHTSSASSAEALEAAADAGEVKLYESGEYPEVSYGLLNTSVPPFDNPTARQAAAAAVDREELQTIINLGRYPTASGPFGPGEMGYLEDTGFPEHDPDLARELVAQYQEETGEELEFTFTVQNTTEVMATAQLIKEQAADVGVTVNIEPVEQATLITKAIAGDFQALSFRNHAGGDPDNQYIWWYEGSPTNFGRIADPEVNRLLDEGRAESDPARRTEIYEELNRRFASEVYDIWLNWTVWSIGTATDVYGIIDTPLPGGGEAFPGLADGHSLAGTWISQ